MQCRRKVLIVVSAAMLILAFLGLGEHHYFLPLFGPVLALFIRLIIRLFQLIFFSQNNIFLSQQISQKCFSAGLSAQQNGSSVRPEFMSRNMDFLHEPVEHGHFVWRNLYHNF
jgi:hypothetical protein